RARSARRRPRWRAGSPGPSCRIRASPRAAATGASGSRLKKSNGSMIIRERKTRFRSLRWLRLCARDEVVCSRPTQPIYFFAGNQFHVILDIVIVRENHEMVAFPPSQRRNQPIAAEKGDRGAYRL